MITRNPLLQTICRFMFCYLVLLSGWAIAEDKLEAETFSNRIILNDEHSEYPLGLQLAIFEDPSKTLTFEDIRTPALASQFTPSNSTAPGFGFNPSAFWVKVELDRQTTQESVWLLEFAYAPMQWIDVYLVSDTGNITHQQGGSAVAFQQRPFPNHKHVFKLDLPADSVTQLYLRVDGESSKNIPLRLYRAEQFVLASGLELAMLSIYAGIIIALFCYNLFVYHTIREPAYLYYILFLAAFLLMALSLNGLTQPLFQLKNPMLEIKLIPFSIGIGGIFGGLFTMHFLHSKTSLPKSHWVLRFIILWGAVSCVIAWFMSYRVAIITSATLGLFFSSAVFIVACVAVYLGNRPARYYLLAWCLLLLGMSLYTLRSFGLLPTNVITEYSFVWGSAAEAILLSVALAARMREMKEEKEATQQQALDEQLKAHDELMLLSRQLEASNYSLEQRVQDRTVDLEHTVAELRDAKETISRFLANMSHEIRTPLTAIIGYSESLRDAPLTPEEASDAINTVVRSSQHLLRIINDILDFSKIEANKLEIERIQTDMFLLMMEIESYFGMMAQNKGILFKVDYRFPLPRIIHTDPTRLKQVLLNLCSNALKFTEQGNVVITTHYQADTNCLYFAVSDTGIGMTAEQAEKVFQPFTQADTSTTRNYGGTGLGLTISKQLAELMGGSLTLDSQPGQGSCFTLSIDCGDLQHTDWVQTNQEAHSSHPQVTDNQPIPELKGHILYAEDGQDNQRLVKLLLKHTGVSLTIVENGKLALEYIQDHQDVDLILMDIQMPVMNGIDATLAIRETGFSKPIIAFTANVMKEEVSRYQQIGCDACLSKPVQKTLFYQTLNDYLGTGNTISHQKAVSNMGTGKHRNNTEKHLKGTVLLAEDNKDNQRLISMQLGRFGIQVLQAENGEQAVQTALEQDIDVILMDMQMPLMDGFEATELLRQTGFTGPIYALTASTDKQDIQRALDVGCDGHLNKPIQLEQLYHALASHLSEQTYATNSEPNASEPDEEMQTLITIFVKGLPIYIAQLQQAESQAELSTLEGLAHQLKGSGTSFGFPEITQQAKQLEAQLKSHAPYHESLNALISTMKKFSTQTPTKHN